MAYRRKQRDTVEYSVPVHRRFPAGKYRRVALVYVLRAMTIPAFAILFGLGIFKDDKTLQYIALGLLGLFVILSLMFWSSASQVICRICKTPFLKHLKCSKKKGKIPHFLGDRSLATALSLVFRRRNITCQYCAERHKYFE